MPDDGPPNIAKKIQYWTPRYAWNRVAWAMYQKRNMDKPWLTPQANRMLATMILPDDVGIEWGSGRSTRWFARKLKHLTSVENHAGWHERVKAQLAERNVTNVDYRLLEVTEGPDERNTPYVRVVDSIANNSLGFALVDGMARATCANEVVAKVKPGGLLIVDNINWFLDHPTHSPASRFGKGHRDDWRSFADRVKNWRMIWTSSGVTDTAIWIKPA